MLLGAEDPRLVLLSREEAGQCPIRAKASAAIAGAKALRRSLAHGASQSGASCARLRARSNCGRRSRAIEPLLAWEAELSGHECCV